MILVFASVGPTYAQVAELADALDSGSSAGNGVEVRILSWAPTSLGHQTFQSAYADFAFAIVCVFDCSVSVLVSVGFAVMRSTASLRWLSPRWEYHRGLLRPS